MRGRHPHLESKGEHQCLTSRRPRTTTIRERPRATPQRSTSHESAIWSRGVGSSSRSSWRSSSSPASSSSDSRRGRGAPDRSCLVPRPPPACCRSVTSRASSPGFAVAVGTRCLPAGLVIIIAAFATSLLFRRGFCGWICPVGTVWEAFAALGRRIFGRNFQLPRWARYRGTRRPLHAWRGLWSPS